MVNLTKVLAGVLLVLAIVLGVFAWTIARRPAPAVAVHTPPPTYAVVVALHTLPAGLPIKATDLDVARISQSPSGSFADLASVVGRVPLADVGAGQPVVDGALLAGLAGRLEPGERAIAIKVDELAGVGGRVRPGDWVDVFMLLRRENQDGEIGRTQARLLLSKIRVLAYGRSDVTQTDTGTSVERTAGPASPGGVVNTAQAQPPRTDGTPNAANDPMNAHTAIVAVPVDRIDALALADTAGRLVLALRNPADTQVADDRVFGPTGTVLVATQGASGLQDDGSNRAAAGLLLEQLVRDKSGVRANATQPPAITQPSMPQAMPVSNRIASSRSSGQSVEVIRGNTRESVGW